MGIKEDKEESYEQNNENGEPKNKTEFKDKNKLPKVNPIDDLNNNESNYIRIDFNYTKTRGMLTQSLIDEIEYMFKQKKLPVKIELIQDGIIIFISLFSKKFLDFITKGLEKVKKENLPERHAKWYISATDQLFYTKSSEMTTIELYKRIKKEMKNIKNLNQFFEKFD